MISDLIEKFEDSEHGLTVDYVVDCAEKFAKGHSSDKKVKIACAIICASTKTVVLGTNRLAHNWNIPEEIWEKKDLVISENVLLNKRDFIIHAEKDAYQKFCQNVSILRKTDCSVSLESLIKDSFVYTSSKPCPDCIVFMVEAGFRNFIFGDVELCSPQKHIKSDFLVDSFNRANPEDKISIIPLRSIKDVRSKNSKKI